MIPYQPIAIQNNALHGCKVVEKVVRTETFSAAFVRSWGQEKRYYTKYCQISSNIATYRLNKQEENKAEKWTDGQV